MPVFAGGRSLRQPGCVFGRRLQSPRIGGGEGPPEFVSGEQTAAMGASARRGLPVGRMGQLVLMRVLEQRSRVGWEGRSDGTGVNTSCVPQTLRRWKHSRQGTIGLRLCPPS